MTDQPDRASTMAAARPLGPAPTTIADRRELWIRWLFLRALGVIFASAFCSLLGQVRGLIGPTGILPAGSYLDALGRAAPGLTKVWAAPTLFWVGGGDRALMLVVTAGFVASLLLTFNFWPRVASVTCTVLFLSCLAVLQDFAAYQSDGMLMQAGVAAVLLAPRGPRPGLAAAIPPSPAAVWLLRWEWFAIYFESGVVKLLSGDPQWRTLTAMDHYYENNPLPTWIGWYVQQLPHWFHAGTVLLTFATELLAPWAIFAPRPVRQAVFGWVSLFQLGIIATANYAFLNYLVLALGLLLLVGTTGRWRWPGTTALAVTLYASIVSFLPWRLPSIVTLPARALAPFRIANPYGLFAVMTTAQYEIEFQGTRDDTTWTAYPFRFKPQDPRVPPGIYAPYHPRFDWNLWFASLGPWTDNPWVVTAQSRLLINDPSVVALFASNPFATSPPVAVRTVLWRYWFTDVATRRATGRWWSRTLLGVYGGPVRLAPADTITDISPNATHWRRTVHGRLPDGRARMDETCDREHGHGTDDRQLERVQVSAGVGDDQSRR